MKRNFIIVLAVLVLAFTALALCGCSGKEVADANGVYANVKISGGAATVEVLKAENGKFVLDTFKVADASDANTLTAEIIEAYKTLGSYDKAESLESKKGDYRYTDNAFIPKRLSLDYENGNNEFCYLKSETAFELSPTVPTVLLYCLLGFAVTLFVLAFLMLVIKLLSLAADKIQAAADKKKKAKEETKGEVEKKEEAPVYAKGSAGEIKLVGVSERDAAMIMAIIADQTGAPINTLRFISITDITDAEVEK
ncbi:MAG: OadG family protein [Clostridia bacterium]|nr:OadG family protein [Clostridia bacterium]